MTTLFDVFSPFAAKAFSGITPDAKFVHYTSASAAVSIFSKREIWMRSSTVMNDLSEARFGFSQLRSSWDGPLGDRLKSLLNGCYPGMSNRVEAAWNSCSNHIITDTYLTCLSQHPTFEDRYGRLSMWRAYSRNAGVALVLNSDAILANPSPLKTYLSPVEYHDSESFADQFRDVCTSLEKNRALIAESTEEAVFSQAFSMLRFAVHCTKHIGFKEELEWRVVHTPGIDRLDLDSDEPLRKDLEVVSGIPQLVYKIPLVDTIGGCKVGLSPNDIISKVLIGPTAFREVTYDALANAMQIAGIENVESKITFSDIPLRNS